MIEKCQEKTSETSQKLYLHGIKRSRIFSLMVLYRQEFAPLFRDTDSLDAFLASSITFFDGFEQSTMCIYCVVTHHHSNLITHTTTNSYG